MLHETNRPHHPQSSTAKLFSFPLCIGPTKRSACRVLTACCASTHQPCRPGPRRCCGCHALPQPAFAGQAALCAASAMRVCGAIDKTRGHESLVFHALIKCKATTHQPSLATVSTSRMRQAHLLETLLPAIVLFCLRNTQVDVMILNAIVRSTKTSCLQCFAMYP